MNLSESESEVAKKFVNQLFDFHQKIGSSLRRLPTLGGKELDVYHLYKKVESLGGYEMVSQGRMWGEVARSFGLPSSVTSASYAIRQHYIRLLEKFETCEKDPTYLAYLQSVASVQTRSTQQMTSAPSPFTSATSPSWKNFVSTGSSSLLSTATPTSVQGKGEWPGYVRLTRSLLSGFPNEVDFTFNILTIITFKSPAGFPLAEVSQLLDLMLSHVGVFPTHDFYDDFGLEGLYHQCWYKSSDMNFMEFWSVTVPEWVCAAVLSTAINTSPNMHNGLFATRHCITEWAMEGYRVEQLATILANLCQISSHLPPLSSHNGVLRFLLLSVHCSLPSVSSTAMDVLLSLAPCLSFPLSPMDVGPTFVTPPLPELLFKCMLECIYSEDRMIVLKGLGVLSEMELSDGFLEHIQREVWQRIFQLLLLPDIQLVLLCLDTLYRFTSNSSIGSTTIFHGVSRCCEVLLSLLTLNVHDFGAEALSKITVLQVTRAPSIPATSAGSVTTPTTRHHAPFPTALNRTTLSSGKPKSGVTILNPSSRFSPSSSLGSKLTNFTKPSSTTSTGVKTFGTQTVKIGNCVIPVVQGTSPLLQGIKSSSSENRLPTILTVQQVQSLLAGKNISITTSTGGKISPGGTGVTVGGGSNITIHRGNTQNADSAAVSQCSSNALLKSYLNKSAAATDLPSNPPFVATNLPSNPPTTSIVLPGSLPETVTDLSVQGTSGNPSTPLVTLSEAGTTNTQNAPAPSSSSERYLSSTPAPLMSTPSMNGDILSKTPSNLNASLVAVDAPSISTTPSPSHTPLKELSPSTTPTKDPSTCHTPSRDSSLSLEAPHPAPSLIEPLEAPHPSSSDPSPSHTLLRDSSPSHTPSSDPSPPHTLLRDPSPSHTSSRDPSPPHTPSKYLSPSRTPSGDPSPTEPFTPHNSSQDPSPSRVPLEAPSISSTSSQDHTPSCPSTTIGAARDSYTSSRDTSPPMDSNSSGPIDDHSRLQLTSTSFARSPSPETQTPSTRNSAPSPSPETWTPTPSRTTSPSPISSIGSSAPPSSTSWTTPLLSSNSIPQQSMEEFTSQWLRSSYEESRGSYVSQLEIYSLYLLASSKVGAYCPLNNSEFNALLRKEFPNALSTKVSVGTQAVYMMAGLAKKRGHGTMKDSVLTLDSAGGVVTQQTMKLSRGPLSTPLASSTTSQTSLAGSRPDYSTQSPLAISSKAVPEVGVAHNGDVGLGLEGVPKAKRIKLTEEMMELSQHKGMKGVNNDIALASKMEKMLAKHHSLIRPSPLERTPSPLLGTPSPSPALTTMPSPAPRSPSPTSSMDSDTPYASPWNSRTASPLALDSLTGINGADIVPPDAALVSGSIKCHWNTCTSAHTSWPALLHHAVSVHVSSLSSFPSPCQWRNCPSKAKRNKPSLMAHLQSSHCDGSESQPSPFNVQKTLARLKALPKMECEVENYLTKAIRLTAALVLRNLAEHLPEAKRRLKSFESELCQVALSGNEASTTVAQCLYYIQTS